MFIALSEREKGRTIDGSKKLQRASSESIGMWTLQEVLLLNYFQMSCRTRHTLYHIYHNTVVESRSRWFTTSIHRVNLKTHNQLLYYNTIFAAEFIWNRNVTIRRSCVWCTCLRYFLNRTTEFEWKDLEHSHPLHKYTSFALTHSPPKDVYLARACTA